MIHKNIEALREDNDLKQKDLCKVLGVAQNTYSQYETGVIALTDEMLIKLALFYNVSVDYLLGLTQIKTPYPKIKRTD